MYKALLLILPLLFISCSKETKLPEKCYEKPNPGMCKAYFKKYYFDTKDKKCKEFIWGGCSGNIPFETYLECQDTCEK